MSIKDYFKTSLLLLYRGKKKLIYTLVILLCVIVSIGVLIFNLNLGKLLNHTLANMVETRTITVMPREPSESITQKERLRVDLDELLNIEHVIDAFDSRHREVVIFESDLDNEHLDGTITLLRGTPNTLPTIIAGKGFEEGETGVAIIPVSFFPTFDPMFVNSEYVIDGKTLLGTTFTVHYHDYIVDKLGELNENQTFSKKFKIIGVYDTAERFKDSGVCYISAQDLVEIADTQNSWQNQQDTDSSEITVSAVYGLNVIVDYIDNIDYVINELETLGFEVLGLGAMVDEEIMTIVRIVITLIMFLTLFTTILITLSYIKKKINSEEKNIAILRASGYPKRTICNIYALESLIHNLFIYIVGSIIMLTIFFVAIYNVPILVGIDLMMGIKINIFPFIVTFFIVTVFPSLFIIYSVIRKCNLDIVNLIESEESNI